MLLVAAVQVVLVRTVDLTPWKGGGFGMFAAVDGGAVRSVRVVVESANGSEMRNVPASLEIDARRAASFPTSFMLSRLARGVAIRERRHGRAVDRVLVEVWSATLSDDGSQAEARRLAVHVYEVSADETP
jgi:hypothetical protein